MTNKISVSDRVLILRYKFSQKKIAEMLNVNVSTVRRWQYNETSPKNTSLKKIIKKSNYVRKKLIKKGSPDVPVPPVVVVHKDTLELIPLSTIRSVAVIDGVVENVKLFFDLAIWYRDNSNKQIFRLLLKTPGGTPDYPESEFINTQWRKLKSSTSKATDKDIARFIVDWYNSPFVLYILKIFVA